MTMARILAFSGSTRSGSCNTRLLGSAIRELSGMAGIECEVTRISLEDYSLPVYDGDLEVQKGVPKNAITIKLARLFHEHDGFLIASPEYNGSLSPLLKNTIDWVSRVSSDDKGQLAPYAGKVAAICAASPGAMGGMTMLYHLRDILVRLNVLVISEQVAVGNAGSAFDNMDHLSDERAAGFLSAAMNSLVSASTLLKTR